jgi:hypothetical protein
MNVDAVVSQSFTSERGSGAVAVYVQYGSGRVADITTNEHTTVNSLEASLVGVQGFSGEWFDLEVCLHNPFSSKFFIAVTGGTATVKVTCPHACKIPA